jgi:hypothetical protein
MSGKINDAAVDLAAFSLAFDRVHYALVRSFLVRNWCGWSVLGYVDPGEASGGVSCSLCRLTRML